MKYSPDLWAEGRRLYEIAGLDINAVAEILKVHPRTVYTHIRQEQWSRQLQVGGTLPLRGVGKGDRKRLTARLFAAFEKQVADLEERITALDGRESDDRDARTLATLAQTLDRLVVLDANLKAEEAAAEDAEEEPDADEFRRDLARRLERLEAARDRDAAGGADGGGDGTPVA